MKHDELVKKLRSGCDANTAFLLCYEAADAITALQARVADLTADILEDGKLRKIAYDQRDKAEADLAAAQIIAATGHPSPCTLGPLCPYCEIERLRANLAAARADAERYRWLRSRFRAFSANIDGQHAWCTTGDIERMRGPNLDAAIDAAIAGERKP